VDDGVSGMDRRCPSAASGAGVWAHG
jgi:hypothetical protein